MSTAALSACGSDTASNDAAPEEQTEAKVDNKTDEKKKSGNGVGDTLKCGDIEFTLDSVENYVDTSDFEIDVPDEGKEFVVLNLTAKNTGDEDDYVNTLYTEGYCDDVAAEEAFVVMYDGEMLSGDLPAGKSRKGYVAYELDKGWNKFEFIYDNPYDEVEESITFEITSSDVK